MTEMIRVFGRIGCLSFGGPAAQIALMRQELVDERPWLENKTFINALSLCMMLPGPEAMQLATYCGWRLRGTIGGLIGGGLFVMPGAIVIALLVWLYSAFGDLPAIQTAFLGVKAAVIAVVIQALYRLSSKTLTTRDGPWLAGLAFVMIFALNVPFPLIISAAAIWGWLTHRGTPPQSSAKRPSRHGVLRIASIWITLWLAPLVALSMAGQTLLADLGWFFAQLAVVTFGGAYAVLAFMTQTVVTEYSWLSTAQMIDALGLAETTPGPLILVTQFVAMLSAALQGGVGLSLAAGIVSLWATFVPCFLWIFLAGPYVDWIGTRPALAEALQSVTGAVVGVILNLSVWFALHVLFASLTPRSLGPLTITLPDISTLDLQALLLTVLAVVWMIVRKRGLGETLSLMALLALVLDALIG